MQANGARAQSALEYILTYGWALLIIAIALSVLLLLGAFNLNAGSGGYCIANTGYTCASPVLNTSGYLSVTFGTQPNPITVTGVGCSTNSTKPAILPITPIGLSAGQLITLVFYCDPTFVIGQHVIDMLWIQFSSASGAAQNASIGTVSASVSTSGSVGTSGSSPSTMLSGASTVTTTVLPSNIFFTANGTGTSAVSVPVSVSSPNQLVICAGADANLADGGHNPLIPGWDNEMYDNWTGRPPYTSIGLANGENCNATASSENITITGIAFTRPVNGPVLFDNMTGGPLMYSRCSQRCIPVLIDYANYTLLNYTATTSNSFAILAVACGAGLTCKPNWPSGCTQRQGKTVPVGADEEAGINSAYLATCEIASPGTYTLNVTLSQGSWEWEGLGGDCNAAYPATDCVPVSMAAFVIANYTPVAS